MDFSWRLLAVEDKQIDARMNIGISGYPDLFPHITGCEIKIQMELMIGYIRSRVWSKNGTPENFVFQGKLNHIQGVC